jgi:hypothetical protein
MERFGGIEKTAAMARQRKRAVIKRSKFDVKSLFSIVCVTCGKLWQRSGIDLNAAENNQLRTRRIARVMAGKFGANPNVAARIVGRGGQNDAKTSDLGGSGSEAG